MKNSYCIGEKGFALEDELFTGMMPKVQEKKEDIEKDVESTEKGMYFLSQSFSQDYLPIARIMV